MRSCRGEFGSEQNIAAQIDFRTEDKRNLLRIIIKKNSLFHGHLPRTFRNKRKIKVYENTKKKQKNSLLKLAM